MPWQWPTDVDACRAGLKGHYGSEFDAGVDRLTTMITRYDTPWPGERAKRKTVANADVAACTKTLVALSHNRRDFCAGVIALAAALLPKSYIAELPNDVDVLREKIGDGR